MIPAALSLTWLLPAALVLQLVGLVLAIRRQLLGFALVGGSALVWIATRIDPAAPDRTLVTMGVAIALFTALGLGLETISERLKLRIGWVAQQTVWGGLIGGMIALFLTNGALGMLIGVLIGTVVVQFSGRSRGMSVQRALIDGLEGFYAMFGAAGLRVLLAVVVIDLFGRVQ